MKSDVKYLRKKWHPTHAISRWEGLNPPIPDEFSTIAELIPSPRLYGKRRKL
jgi:hypothetical protein